MKIKHKSLANKYPKKIASGKLAKDAVNAIFKDKYIASTSSWDKFIILIFQIPTLKF